MQLHDLFKRRKWGEWTREKAVDCRVLQIQPQHLRKREKEKRTNFFLRLRVGLLHRSRTARRIHRRNKQITIKWKKGKKRDMDQLLTEINLVMTLLILNYILGQTEVITAFDLKYHSVISYRNAKNWDSFSTIITNRKCTATAVHEYIQRRDSFEN